MSSDSENEDVLSDNLEEINDVTEEERQAIRNKISNMSFENLIKMKEEMGSKVYNETVYGVKKKKAKTDFKRANKNRPREMSSKIRVKPLVSKAVPAKKVVARDPRFDPLCGQFDNKTFKTNYKFLHEVRKKEKTQLEKEYKTETDPEKKRKIKLLIQRMQNQIREQEKKEEEDKRNYEERQETKLKIKQGEKPLYKKKSIKKLESLIEKYEELKKTNKLQKHIEKRTKKLSSKDKKRMLDM